MNYINPTFQMNQLGTNEWDFPIETCVLHASSIYVDNTPVPPSMAQAIVRTDTRDVLGVHGSKYKAVKHDDVVNSIFDSVKKSNISTDYTHKIECFENGAKLRGVISFDDLTIEPEVGDHVKFEIMFYNSYDGSWAFQQIAQGLRLWCLNGCTTGDTISNTRFKHTSSIDVQASSHKIQKGLDSFFNQKELWKTWMKVKVDTLQAEQFFKQTLAKVFTNTTSNKHNEKQLELLMKLWFNEYTSLGKNKWALYNVCTYWATHTEMSSSPANTQHIRQAQLSKVFNNNHWKALV